MDANEVKRRILTACIASAVICLTSNKMNYVHRHRKYFVEATRELKYRDDLSARSCVALRRVIRFTKSVNITSTIMSLLPGINILYTARNMAIPDETLAEFYNEQIDKINGIEIETRKAYLEEIKNFRYIPEEIEKRMDEEDYLPSEIEYSKVLMANMPTRGFGLILSFRPMLPNQGDVSDNGEEQETEEK